MSRIFVQRRSAGRLRRAEPRLDGGFSVQLLHGVTGSGKTEIYLQAIRKIVAAEKTGDRAGSGDRADAANGFAIHSRFKRVAILHSGLSAPSAIAIGR